MCACQKGILCPRCREEAIFDLEVLGVLPEPASPAEEREQRQQEHQARAVQPTLESR